MLLQYLVANSLKILKDYNKIVTLNFQTNKGLERMRRKIIYLVLIKSTKLWFCNGYAIKQILCVAYIQERLMVTLTFCKMMKQIYPFVIGVTK